MKHRILALAAALACMAGLAQASTLRIEATGTIATVGSAFAGSFSPGQSASLIWEINTSAPATTVTSNVTNYNATTFISMTFNGVTYSDSFAGNMIQVTDRNSGPFLTGRNDLNDETSLSDIVFAGVSDLRYQANLRGTDDFLTGTSLTQSLDPAKITLLGFRMVGGNGVDKILSATADTATFTTAVPIPVPAALPLLVTALAGLGLLRRRRRSPAL